MKVIVGLGNPGQRYALTKHNIGFWVVDRLSHKWQIPIDKEKWKAEVGEAMIDGEKILLAKPQTYMNLSGESVRQICDFFQLHMDDLLVIYDDLDLPMGKIRLRLKGSSGGHNGMKSIIDHLKTEKLKRIKIGIGRPEGLESVSDYVLSPFRKEDLSLVEEAVERSVQAVQEWLRVDFNHAMNHFN